MSTEIKVGQKYRGLVGSFEILFIGDLFCVVRYDNGGETTLRTDYVKTLTPYTPKKKVKLYEHLLCIGGIYYAEERSHKNVEHSVAILSEREVEY